MKLVLTEKEFKRFDKILRRHFELTRKEYEEQKINNSFYKLDFTRTYKQDMKDSNILKNILSIHENKKCLCFAGGECYYTRYKKNLITEKEILSEIYQLFNS